MGACAAGGTLRKRPEKAEKWAKWGVEKSCCMILKITEHDFENYAA